MNLELLPFHAEFSGIPILARLVRQGEGFGRAKETKEGIEFSCINDADEPLVEFYDERYSSDRECVSGQFITRYRLSQIDDLKAGSMGMCLDGGVPEREISGNDLRKVVTWVKNCLNDETDPSDLTVEEGLGYRTLIFSSASESIDQLQSLGCNGWMKTLGVEVDYADDKTMSIRPINSRHQVGRCEIRIPKDKAHLQAMIDMYQFVLDDLETSKTSTNTPN